MNPYLIYLATAARWIVGAALLVAGATKLQSSKTFANTVAGYGVLPRLLTRPVGVALPLIEVLLGLALLLGIGTAVAGAISAALFAVFGAAVAWNLARGNRVPCGCFGASRSELIGPGTLVRDTALFGCSIMAALLANPYLVVTPFPQPDSGPLPPRVDGFPLALMSAATLAVYLVVGTMLGLRERRVP